ncbi:SDR family NAD(P)-dependent oxidoreductase [bacterium]|nr:SDR family NAD(P)-dependent oxidoreductase [bacterium]
MIRETIQQSSRNITKSKTVLVTGGAGFIGSHLVRKLVEKGREVIVIDDLSSGSLENLSSLGLKPSDFEFKKIDLTNYSQILECLKEGDIVFHLAARIGGLKYLHGTENAEIAALQANLAIDANVFRASLEKRVEKIIYASSTAVYPLDSQYSAGAIFSEEDFLYQPEKQDPRFRFKMDIDPDGGYGLAKLLGEVQLSWMKNIKIAIARIFNVYGVNEPLDEKSHAISDLIRKAIDYPQKEFIIWGDGKQTRDYMYVSDCVDALVKLEEKISDYQPLPLILNIGSGKATSISELAEVIIKISGKNIKPKYDVQKPVGPISRTADIRKVKETLNWEPKVSLEEGLKRTFVWIQKKIT